MTGATDRPSAFDHGLERYISRADLETIGNIRIGMAGAGGLGSNCAALLARSGFKKFTLVDDDTVDISNLNRQFFFYHQTGRPKVDMLRDNLMAICPDLDIRTLNTRLTADNLKRCLKGCQVIVEAVDRPETKKLIVETYLNSQKLLVAASGISGHGITGRLTIRKIRETVYIVGDGISGTGSGSPPLAPGVAAAAAMQADIIVSYILGRSMP
ncbi:MAG: sulfur carrier protein ThiS adenylyltransferase ThiF [Pseudomonadota bacterium]